jgi:hypothetical protein
MRMMHRSSGEMVRRLLGYRLFDLANAGPPGRRAVERAALSRPRMNSQARSESRLEVDWAGDEGSRSSVDLCCVATYFNRDGAGSRRFGRRGRDADGEESGRG